jgi:hypothetical protein
VNTQGIENNVYKINTFLSSTDNQTITISSLQALLNENISDMNYLGTLTENHTTQLNSYDDDLFALQGRLDIEEQKNSIFTITDRKSCSSNQFK